MSSSAQSLKENLQFTPTGPSKGSKKVVVSLDLDAEQLSHLEAAVSDKFELRKLSLSMQFDAIESALQNASVIFIKWDGKKGRAKPILEKLKINLARNQNTKSVFALLRLPEKSEDLSPTDLKILGLAGVIEWPRKSFSMAQVLFDIQPDEAALDELTKESAGSWEKLSLPVSSGINPDSAAAFALRFKGDFADEVKRPFIYREDFVVYHPDTGLASEIANALLSSSMKLSEKSNTHSIKRTTAFTTLDDVLLSIRRGAGGVLIWSDGVDPVARLLLEHLAEARRSRRISVMIVVPGPMALQLALKSYTNLFFDSMTVYDRKEGLSAAIQETQAAFSKRDAPRGLLERLREHALASGESVFPVGESLKELSEKLRAIPGKRYWALADFIPNLLKSGDVGAAEQVMNVLNAEAGKCIGVAFDCLIVRHVVAARLRDRDSVAIELVDAVFAYPELTKDRLYRVGQMLERWKAWSALARLLNHWYERVDLVDDSQMLWLASRYHLAIDKQVHAGCLVARSVLLAPGRFESLETLATLLALGRKFGRAGEIAKLSEMVCTEPTGKQMLDLKIRAVDWFLIVKNQNEARVLVAEILAVDPNHTKAKEYSRKLAQK